METVAVHLNAVLSAADTIAAYVHRTPLLHSTSLSELTRAGVWLKPENLQRTGSFKVRGGINVMAHLSPEERARGVIAVSAGNHGAGVAYAARMLGVKATIVMPTHATRSKVAAVEAYGGRVVLVDGSRLMESLEEIQEREGQTFIHPFENPYVIAGQGTVGLEIVQDAPDVEVVVVGVGGGGLISGIATAVKGMKPETQVIGVEPEVSCVVSDSLAAGRPLRAGSYHSIADGLNAPWSGPNTLQIVRQYVDRIVTVSEDEIRRAMALVMERTKLVVEPAGAASVAALLSTRVPEAEGRKTVAVLSGGNVDLARLGELLTPDSAPVS